MSDRLAAFAGRKLNDEILEEITEALTEIVNEIRAEASLWGVWLPAAICTLAHQPGGWAPLLRGSDITPPCAYDLPLQRRDHYDLP